MAGERRALIIATGEYEDPKLARLRAPAADADRLAAVLGNPEIGSFQVEVAQDEDERSLRMRLSRFFKDRRPDDLLLVHVSCHGIKDDRGHLYLAARDTEIDVPDATALSADWLNDRITYTRARATLLLLDCCFAGRFPFGMRRRAGDDVGVGDHLGGRGRAVISASTEMEYAYEGEELSGEAQGSVFTTALVEGLETGEADRDRDKWISVDDLYGYVYDRVKAGNPAQTPVRQGALEGDFYVARSVYEPPIEPATLDAQLLGLVEHPVAGARFGAVDELTRLHVSANKSIALAARLTLERMLEDDSRRVANHAKAALAKVVSDNEQARQGTEEQQSEPPQTRLQASNEQSRGESSSRARPEVPKRGYLESQPTPRAQPRSTRHRHAISIVYRRYDYAPAADLYYSLTDRFGVDHIFFDSLDWAGGDFRADIKRRVASSKAVLVLIGRAGLESTDETGRRIDDRDDFVRVEIATALEDPEVQVIPLLLDGADLPTAEQLPDELVGLTRVQGLAIHRTAWHADLARLIERLVDLGIREVRRAR